MSTRNWIGSLVMVFGLAAAAGAAEAKGKLRLGWPSGECIMTIVSQSQGTTTIAGQKLQLKDRTTQVWQLSVSKPNDKDEKKMTMRLVDVKSEGEDRGRAHRYDSAAGGSSEQAFVYGPLMAGTVVVTLDADDTVVEVVGLDKLWGDLSAKAANGAKKDMVAQMRIAMGDKFFEMTFRRLESLMPKSAVAPGDTWKTGVRLDLPVIGELKARYECKLTGVTKAADGDVAAIEAASSYSLAKPKSTTIEGVELTLTKVELEEKAKLKLNVKAGRVLSDECIRSTVVVGKVVQDGKEQDIESRTTTEMKTTFAPGICAPAKPSVGAESKPSATTTGMAASAGEKPKRDDMKPVSVILRRQWEPRQKAFSVLVPAGWLIEGGLFSVDPTQGGGTLNAIETKCDFTVKKDAAGSVMVRWCPTWNFVDFSRSQAFATMSGLFPVGRIYNGALVKPMPTIEDYLVEGFRLVRPTATDARITQRVALPEVAEILHVMNKDINATMAQLGKAPMTFTAGAVVFDYTEGAVRYREAAATALCDWRAGTGLWNNQFTFHMRAPSDQADAWKPVCDIVRQSLQINPQWLAAYVKAVGERGQQAAETFRTLARIDQEIFERRSKQRSAIQDENYLLLTGQEDYVNPFTGQAERDTSDYKHRWTNSAGDRYYSNAYGSDPNKDPAVNQLEWKQTLVRPR